jgi:hypothetical protein
VSLASFRSPFVGAGYGVIATLWLMGLLAALSQRRTAHWILGLLALGGATALLPSPGHPPSTVWLLISGALVFACMALNGYAVLLVTHPRTSRWLARESPCYHAPLPQVMGPAQGGV